jgi:hypothetical protein
MSYPWVWVGIAPLWFVIAWLYFQTETRGMAWGAVAFGLAHLAVGAMVLMKEQT